VIGERARAERAGSGWWKRDQMDNVAATRRIGAEEGGTEAAPVFTGTEILAAISSAGRGESRESLGGYGDDISSIRVFGNARALIYDDRNFTGKTSGAGWRRGGSAAGAGARKNPGIRGITESRLWQCNRRIGKNKDPVRLTRTGFVFAVAC